MTDQRTKARLAVSELQSASRTKFEAERDFTRAQGRAGKFPLRSVRRCEDAITTRAG